MQQNVECNRICSVESDLKTHLVQLLVNLVAHSSFYTAKVEDICVMSSWLILVHPSSI